MGLRITWIPNKSPPQVRVPFTLVHSPSSGSIFKFSETHVRKTFDTRSNCTRPSRKSSALIPLVGKIRGRNTGEISKNENLAKPYKEMTPPLTQNLKALGLWVFFLICCSTFSFLLNVRLRLTLGYLTNLPLK